MPEKAVAPRDDILPDIPRNDELDPLSGVSPDELELPVMKLVQAVSREADTAKAGQFHDQISNAYRELLNIAVVRLSRSRSLFGDSFDEPPICASDDAVTPRERVQTHDILTGPTCGECPLSQWGSADGGRGQACRYTWNLLCYDIDLEEPYILRVSGTSLKPWRRYMTAAKRRKLPLYAVKTVVSSEAQTFERGKAHVLRFVDGGALEPDLALAMRQEAANFQGVSLGVQEAGELDAAEETEAPDGGVEAAESVFE